MGFQYAKISDKGIAKSINQDSCMAIEASTMYGQVFLGAVCDGMGGLEQGEVASKIMTNELESWFNEDLPYFIEDHESENGKRNILLSLNRAANRANLTIAEYAKKNGIRCGTTATVLLVIDDSYFVMNVGDSRAYLFRNRLFRLTKDQTVVQKKIESGEITDKEAESDKQRSVLLQCIGSGRPVHPEFKTGQVSEGDVYLLCSDGFRHKVTEEEIERSLRKENPVTETQLEDVASFLVELNKERKEKDNITCVMARCS